MRTSRFAYALLVPLFALAAAGCGGKVVVDPLEPVEPVAPTCTQVCAEVLAVCPAEGADCQSSCATIDGIVLLGACVDAIDAFMTCLHENPASVCSAGADPCAADEQAFQGCVTSYCAQNPTICSGNI